MLPKTLFEGTIAAFWVFVVVCVIAVVSIWVAWSYYVPHRIAELSPLTPEQIRRRKAIYGLVRTLAGLAVLGAVLGMLHSCGG
jgi:hypothetical protein